MTASPRSRLTLSRSRVIVGVLLDVGGTLWPERGLADNSAERMSRLMAAFPTVTGAQARDFLEQFRVLAPLAERGLTQDVIQLLDQASKAAGLELNHGQLQEARRALCVPAAGHFQLFAGAEALLRTIRHLGLGCALVSNASVRTGGDYRRDFAGFGLANAIDVCVSSVDVGIRKPDPRIFAAALDALRREAAQAVVVGNSEPNDVEPARRLGAHAIRVAIEEPLPVSSSADAVVTSLAGVAEILGRSVGG